MPAPGLAVGRGQGPAGFVGNKTFRRPAATAHHRPRPLASAGGALPGRVFHRHRPGYDHAHRGCAQETEVRNDDHPRDEPRSAGPPPGQPHDVPLERRGGGAGHQRGHFQRSTQRQTDLRIRQRDYWLIEAMEYSITTRDLCLWYGRFQALKNVTVNFRQGLITSLIGPSGCGKTTLLRCFNRVNERYGEVTTTGEIRILDTNIYAPGISWSSCARQWGWFSSGRTRCPYRFMRMW